MLRLENSWSLNAEVERWYPQENQGETEMEPKGLIVVNVNTLSVLLEVEDLSHLWVGWWRVRSSLEQPTNSPWVPQNCVFYS